MPRTSDQVNITRSAALRVLYALVILKFNVLYAEIGAGVSSVYTVTKLRAGRYRSSTLKRNKIFLGAFAKLREATVSFVTSVRPYGTTRRPLDGF